MAGQAALGKVLVTEAQPRAFLVQATMESLTSRCVSCPEPRASCQLPSNYIEVLNRGSVMRRSLEKFHVMHCRD